MNRVIALVLLLAACGLGWYTWSLCLAPDGGPFYAAFDSEDSIADIAETLTASGVIRSPLLFRAATWWMKAIPVPGRYVFISGLRPWSAVRILEKGPPPDIKEILVTFPEGTRLEEFAARLDESGITSGAAFLKLAYDFDFVRNLIGIDAPSLEGFLFPDSYRFLPRTSPEKIIARLHDQFLSNLPDYSQTGFSLMEFVTLASIVQREGLLDRERPRIAAVFLNRLKRGMKLEADPTIRFALGRYDTEPILYADLDTESPYNTYRSPGIPPSPISSVGKASLYAVVNPVESDELFFVATGFGTHYFAATHAQHLRNKEKYKAERNRQLRSDN